MDMKKTLIALGFFLAPMLVEATNGYFSSGTGIKNRALAGAGVAFPLDAMAAATNPAGMAFVGNQLDVGLVLFNPERGYATTDSVANGLGGAFTIGPAAQDSGDNLFLIPSFGINKIISEHAAIGFSVYGNGGLNTTYKGRSTHATFDPDGPGPAPVSTFPGVFAEGTAGTDLNQLFFNFSYAHKFSDNLSAGISPVVALQSFRANGLGSLTGFTKSFVKSGGTQTSTSLTRNGQDYSFGGGLQVGVLAKNIIGRVDAGVSYRSRIWMSEFDKYEDLLAQAGDFDIPPTLWSGIAVALNKDVTFVFDYQKIWYDEIDSLGNDFARLFDCPALGGSRLEACLGGEGGAGFGWNDVDIFKFGLQWQHSPAITWRLGYSHMDQPIDRDQVLFNILATAVVEDHIAAGFTYRSQHLGEFNFEVMHALHHAQDGSNPLDPTQSIRIRMKQYELGLGWTKSF